MADSADDDDDDAIDAELWTQQSTRGDLARFALKQQRLTLITMRYALALRRGDNDVADELFNTFISLNDELAVMLETYVRRRVQDD